jgi:hypothetical protein
MITLEEIEEFLVPKNEVNILGTRSHSKASEIYVDVSFTYPREKYNWEGSVPIHYRRTGIFANTAQE